MQSKKHFSLLALAFICLFSYSCKDDDPTADTTKPVITIISPLNGATVNAGTSMPVNATILEAGELNRVEITGQLGIFSQTETIQKSELPAKNGDIYEVNDSYNIPDGLSGTVNITVKAIDEAGNSGTATLTLNIQ